MADLNPVGKGREEANMDPYLPKPFGRIEFTINPFAMLNQLIPEKYRKKFWMYCCCVVCCVLCIGTLPMTFSSVVSNTITGMFK